jgi:hypothetical protein
MHIKQQQQQQQQKAAAAMQKVFIGRIIWPTQLP